MSKFQELYESIVLEMAAPSSSILKKTYFHGTSTFRAAKSIAQEGKIVPASSVDPLGYKAARGIQKPIEGRSYLTADVSYALVYALAGDVAGNEFDSKRKSNIEDPYGFVFEIDGRNLTDVQPDEDGVGEMIADMFRKKNGKAPIYKFAPSDKLKASMWNLINKRLTAKEEQKLNIGFAEDETRIGKKMLKYMSDEDKIGTIEAGVHVGHLGAVVPSRVYLVKKSLSAEFKRDGSNFFQIATPMSLSGLASMSSTDKIE